LLRMLGSTTVAPGNEYVPNLPVDLNQVGVDGVDSSTAERPPEIVTANVRELDPVGRAAAHRPSEMRTESAAGPGVRGGPSGNRAVDAVLRAGGTARPATRKRSDDLLDEAG
ncbi:MAG TPA: hypothetical protein VI110_14710, partial [Lapillicoccus sp.]